MSTPQPVHRVRVQRIAEAAVERARLTVVPRVRRSRAPRVPFVTLVSLVLLGGVVGLLMLNTTMQQNAFAASALEAEAADLTSREQTLRMQLEVLRNPQRVAERAQALGMVPAPTPAFLRLSDGRVLGVPAVATPAERVDIRPTKPRRPAVLAPRRIVVEVPAERRARDRAERARDTGRASADRGERTGRNGSTSTRGDRSSR